jgi:N-acetylglucosamine-6-sulfatase
LALSTTTIVSSSGEVWVRFPVSLACPIAFLFFDASASVQAALAQTQSSSQPNFIVVIVDDLRADALGATGHPFVRNPSIDRIAEEGMRFRNAFVVTPLCSPARASFLTGRYARSHGIRTNGSPDSGLVTFPRLLETAGYDTAFIGKWHMGEDDGPRPGFTHWVSFPGQGVYGNPELNVNGRREIVRGYTTDILNFYAADFVRTASRGTRPFLLVLSHKAAHAPFNPPWRHRDLYADEVIRCSLGCDDKLENKLALTREVPGTVRPTPGQGPTDDDIRSQLALLSSVDDGIADLWQVLDEEGELDRTAIVLTSDNGFFYREHGLGDKRWPYEEAIRIPFLLYYPPLVEPALFNDSLVLNVDLAPTLLDLAGVAVPADIQGRSLVPLLSGEGRGGWREAFAGEYFEEAPFPRIPSWEAIRTERFKYVRYPELGPAYDELYDLLSDRYELRNAIGDSSLSQVLDELRSELDQLLSSL